MTRSSLGLSSELSDYVSNYSTQPDQVQRKLQGATADLGNVSGMQIDTTQGTFLALLIHAIQPSFVVEIGTFTGYSALAMAQALPEGARLLCCDVSQTWTDIAATHWEAAGVSDRIDLEIAPASETLSALEDDQTIGFAFIDADKTGYIDYYEQILPRLAPNGLMAIDNTLWSRQVLDLSNQSEDTVALRAFNAHVADDPRSEQVILPVGDGVTLLRRAN